MDALEKNPRDMTDEEIRKWMQEWAERAAEEKGCAGGTCSFQAVRNPVRRNILKTLKERPMEMEELSKKAGIDGPALKFQLNFLQSGNFIAIKGNTIDLTPAGVSFLRGN